MCRTWAPSSLWSSCQFSQSPPLSQPHFIWHGPEPQALHANTRHAVERERKKEKMKSEIRIKRGSGRSQRERERFHSPGLVWVFLTRVEPHNTHTHALAAALLCSLQTVCPVCGEGRTGTGQTEVWCAARENWLREIHQIMLREKFEPMAGSGRAAADKDSSLFYCGKYCDFVFFYFYCNHQIAGQEQRPIAQMALRNAFPAISAETH